MSRAVVLLHSLLPISCSDDSAVEHFLARVTFTLQIGAQTFANLTSHIKLTTGSQGAERSFEVSPPLGYGGPFNHVAFHEVLERCCRAVLDERRVADRSRAAVSLTTDPILMQERHEFPVGGSAAAW